MKKVLVRLFFYSVLSLFFSNFECASYFWCQYVEQRARLCMDAEDTRMYRGTHSEAWTLLLSRLVAGMYTPHNPHILRYFAAGAQATTHYFTCTCGHKIMHTTPAFELRYVWAYQQAWSRSILAQTAGSCQHRLHSASSAELSRLLVPAFAAQHRLPWLLPIKL